tara:strand:+ start:89 stop:442 length:354 start_codon:yes stop_codon:yes gene_type:complete
MSKKRFLIFGLFNLITTNIILQILLVYLQILLATLISQIIGMIIGFFLYGKYVFKNSSLNILKLIKYLSATLFIWLINWFGIYFLSASGIKKNLAALLLIPFLSIISYLIQKKKVFV